MIRTRTLLGGALVALAGCSEAESDYPGAFDQPVAAAVLAPESGGPFTVPVGYVADRYGGRISLLDLDAGVFLADKAAASFARNAPLATGADRVLGAIAPWAPDAETVHVFAADHAHGHVVQVPHVVGVGPGGVPRRPDVSASEITFVDDDGSGDAARLTDLQVRPGVTATESWTVTREADAWTVTGSRSGRLAARARTGSPFVSDDGALAFTIEGGATDGDRFEFATSSGIVEHDVGGLPVSLAMSPDQSRLAVVVRDRETEALVLRALDPSTGDVSELALPADAAPGRLTWHGDTLFVSDAENPAVWEVDAKGAVTTHTLPWPTLDVAPLDHDDGTLLFVVPVTGRSVWVYDVDRGVLRDANAWRPGDDGIAFTSPVRGVGALPGPFDRVAPDDDGETGETTGVAISLASGEVVFMEPSGCLVTDALGPRTEASSSFGRGVDYQTSFDKVGGAAFLEQNGTNARHAVVNPCGGVAPSETWTLRYRVNQQAWVVEGSVSGTQEALAYEDVRYVSDGGEISFTIRSGAVPSQEGWLMEIQALSGVVRGDGENDGVSPREVEIILPGDPVGFSVDIDGEAVPYVLVTSEGSDLAARIDPADGFVDAQWW